MSRIFNICLQDWQLLILINRGYVEEAKLIELYSCLPKKEEKEAENIIQILDQ